MTEQIEWIACAERVPDDDQTVMLCLPGKLVWPGWHDCDRGWRWADDVPADGVTHWAELPDGPA
jgi:hypothetical protein